MHKTELIGTTLAGIILLSGCLSANESNKTPLVELSPTSTDFVEVTGTPMPTELPTEVMMATEVVVENYAIDMEKLLNPAPSYEYMVEHPKEYQQAPDLLSDVEAFKDWYYIQYVPALLLGHEEKMQDMSGFKFSKRNITNVTVQAGGSNPRGEYMWGCVEGNEMPINGELPIAYFMHEGVMYPILAFTIETNEGNNGTVSVILHPPSGHYGEDGFDAIKNLYDGKGVLEIIESSVVLDDELHPELVSEFLKSGFNWQVEIPKVGPFFKIGLGGVMTKWW